jgi:hypothetical protein
VEEWLSIDFCRDFLAISGLNDDQPMTMTVDRKED